MSTGEGNRQSKTGLWQSQWEVLSPGTGNLAGHHRKSRIDGRLWGMLGAAERDAPGGMGERVEAQRPKSARLLPRVNCRPEW
jgi:hypothetical protein